MVCPNLTVETNLIGFTPLRLYQEGIRINKTKSSFTKGISFNITNRDGIEEEIVLKKKLLNATIVTEGNKTKALERKLTGS